MAIFHCQAKAISRSAGRSATAASAYRSGDHLQDERTGEIHDYRKKKGVEHAEIFCPPGVEKSRSELWNAVEMTEKRKDAKVAREWEIALPDELSKEERKELACSFGKALVERYGIAAEVCIHAPSKEGDQRNHHAHVLTTTRVVKENGELGEKVRILDSPLTSGKEVAAARHLWADMTNKALEKAGHEERIDPRTLAEQGVEQVPTRHMGRAATAIQRRGEEPRRTAIIPDNPDKQAMEPEQREAQAELDGQIAFFQKAKEGAKDFRSSYAKYKAELAEKARLEVERLRDEARKQERIRAEREKLIVSSQKKKVERTKTDQEWER